MSMRRGLLIGAGLLAALVLVVAWLTGREAARQIEAALSSPMSLGPGHITLLALDHGLLRSNAGYLIDWPLGNGEQARITLAQRIDHGPLPLLRVQRGALWPAALASEVHIVEAVIERAGETRALPARADIMLSASYTGAIDASAHLDIPDLPLGPISLALNALTLRAHHELGSRALTAQLDAPRVELRQGGESTARLDALTHTLTATLSEQPAITLTGGAATLTLWGQPLGPLTQSLTMRDVDLDALGQALGGRTDAWASALPASAQLAGTLASVRHPAGEAMLQITRTPNAPGAQLRFHLPKAVVLGAVAAPSALAALGPIAQQQATMAYGLIAGQLLATGFVHDAADGLHADITLTAEQALVNGEAHDWPSFRARFLPGAK